MIILSTHHKGGVGKTTLAVHAAGALVSQPGRVLVVDCDSQADAFRFFARRGPERESDLAPISGRLSVLWNPGRRPLRHVADAAEYDHVLLDIDSPLENTVQTVVQNDPDLVYVPISLPHQALGLLHLPDTLSVISALEQRAGRSPRVTIVPLGAAKGKIEAALRGLRERPRRCSVAAKARSLLRQTSAALAEGRYVREYDDCQDQLDYFCSLVGVGEREGKE
jgi:chromosome partitioning protein